jgi:hypothetical protein
MSAATFADAPATTTVARLRAAIDRKRLATAQARAALRGIELQVTDNDRGAPLYVASMHALTRAFDDLAEVETWLVKIGA